MRDRWARLPTRRTRCCLILRARSGHLRGGLQRSRVVCRPLGASWSSHSRLQAVPGRQRRSRWEIAITIGEGITGLGYVAGIVVLIWAAKKKHLLTDGMTLVAVAGLTGGILGAKLTELIFEGWPVKVGFVSGLVPTAGGRALVGGLVFGWATVEVVKRKLGIRRSTGDLFALALPAGEAVGRIGCFFNTCCFGTTSTVPWAVYQHGAWRHPTQIYSAITAGLIFAALLYLRERIAREGDLFKLYLVLFGATRFGLEFVRANDTYWLGLTPMQWVCIDLVAYGSLTLLRSKRDLAPTA